jgi:ketosteroid isomerase-like protein
MSEENVEFVRKPVRLGVRSGRTLDQRLALRFPRLAAAYARLIGRLPPRSRLRQAALWRGVRLGVEAFNRRDHDAALAAAAYAPDFEYHPPRELVEAGFVEPLYRGPEGYHESISTWSDIFGADLRVEPVELIDLGDRIVLLADAAASGNASGVPVAEKLATVWVLKAGQVIRLEAYFDQVEALKAVGLPE